MGVTSMKADYDYELWIATQIHYPECWDTMAYPTLFSAIWEIICWTDIGCSNEDCNEIHKEDE